MTVYGRGVEPAAQAPHDTAAAATPARGPEPVGLAGLRVLFAEDNPTHPMVAVEMLRALGAAVTVASDGVEALEMFETEAVDLLVVDIEMPRLSGLDVIRTVRARGNARAGTPIVALIADALREHRARIAEAGATGLVSKPITSVEAFGRALAGHLPRRAAPACQPEPDPSDPAPSDEAVVDQEIYAALALAIGDEMMAELLDKVVGDLAATRGTLAAARAGLDRGPIRTASHILISVSGALGAKRLQAQAQAVSAAAHAPGDASLAAELDACLPQIDAAMRFAERQRAAF